MTPILLVGARTERLEAEQVGQLAREGHQVVHFKDTESNRFVAVAVDGLQAIHNVQFCR